MMSNYEDIAKNKSIEECRIEIDKIDEKIVNLLNERLLYGKQIGKEKFSKGNQILDTGREKEVLERLQSINNGPLAENVLHYIYSVIITATKEIQKPLMISYLGPEATYTHIAAMNYFGHSGTFVPKYNIKDIFADVERGDSNFGVVPVENSIEGAVNPTLDQLFETDLKIASEKYQPISHALLSKTGEISDISIVYSHPQPFGQCRNWLANNLPGVQIEECSSTARAAQKASENSNIAAIASTKAAQIYNLKVIRPQIADYSKNVTRFLILSKDQETKKTGNDKTSIMFVTAHNPGALFNALEPVANAGLNIVKLESRPTKRQNWNYFFIMDIEGHIEDKNLQDALLKMQEFCLFHKNLGSYPNLEHKIEEIEKID